MKKPLYRRALAQGWELASHHKFLWVYGIFAALLGHVGLTELVTHIMTASSSLSQYMAGYSDRLTANGAFVSSFVWQIESRFAFVWLLTMLLALGMGLVFVALVCEGALIHSASVFTRTKKLPLVGPAWHAGVAHSGKLFLIHAVRKLIFFAVMLVVGIAAYDAVYGGFQENLLFLSLFLLAAIFGTFLSFFSWYTACYVVVEGLPLGRAWQRGWRLFFDHWLVSLEVGLIFLGLQILLTVVGFFGFIFFFSPALVAGSIAAVIGSPGLATIGIYTGMLFGAAWLILLGAFFTVFTRSVWTTLFMVMHREGVRSRVMHWFSLKA